MLSRLLYTAVFAGLVIVTGCKSSPPEKAEVSSTSRPAEAPAQPTTAPAPADPAVDKPDPKEAVPSPQPVAAEGAVACAGSSACKKGQHCSTEDGVCNKAPGCGPGKICPQVCYGTCVSGPSKSASDCVGDSDCRAHANYCKPKAAKDACRCQGLPKSAPDPKCTGGTIACLVNPCDGKVAACRGGECVVTAPVQ